MYNYKHIRAINNQQFVQTWQWKENLVVTTFCLIPDQEWWCSCELRPQWCRAPFWMPRYPCTHWILHGVASIQLQYPPTGSTRTHQTNVGKHHLIKQTLFSAASYYATPLMSRSNYSYYFLWDGFPSILTSGIFAQSTTIHWIQLLSH